MRGDTESLIVLLTLLIPAFIGGVLGALVAWWLDMSFVWTILGGAVLAYLVIALLIIAEGNFGPQ